MMLVSGEVSLNQNNNITDMELGRININLYKMIIIPKAKIEFIKYLDINIFNTPSYQELLRGKN